MRRHCAVFGEADLFLHLELGRVGDIRWELVRSFRFFLSGVVVYLAGSC